MKQRLALFILFIMTAFYSPLTSQGQTSDNKPKVRLNHIAVYVVDLKISSDFYAQVIGLDTIPEPFHDGRHTWFSVGPFSHLHVISGATAPTSHNKNSHLCFSVPSVDKFIAELDKRKIGYENWAGEKQQVTKRVDGVKQIWFNDPDGYWIEINDDFK